MAQQNPGPKKSLPRLPGSRFGWLRIFLLIALGATVLVLLVNYLTSGEGKYTAVPRSIQLNYVPADFEPEIDEANALAILRNPNRYAREFNELVYRFNLSLLQHISKRMNLPDSLRSQVRLEYEKHHPYLRNMYFNDFVALKDTSATFYREWYQNENASSVEALKEVASKYTCFMVTTVFGALLETSNGRISIKGRDIDTPCGVAMTEVLGPTIERLKDRAAVEDFSRSKGFLQEKVERVTAELATMEVRDKKGINRKLQTKLWGFNVSSTELEVTAVSVMKIGFDLEKFFQIDMDPGSKTVTVTLPNPEILSHEVYPKVDKLDIGWLREVQNVDFNKNFDLLRKEFRREALESDVMDKAKAQATELMDTMLSPLISSMNRSYQLRVRFKNLNPAAIEFEEESFGYLDD